MLFFVPYEIETLQQERPWANWLIITVCSLISISAMFGSGLEDGAVDSLILDGFSLPGLFGHVLLHADLFHLIGNMIFLWVFGNAICTNTNNWVYLALFLACTLVAATVHVLMDGSLAIGASGAINGVVGVVLAMYPLNRVHVFWLFLIKWGTFPVRAWVIILAWLAFDIWGVLSGGSLIAYWAHIGGLFGGLAIGLTALHFGWFQMTTADNRSLLEILKGEKDDEVW